MAQRHPQLYLATPTQFDSAQVAVRLNSLLDAYPVACFLLRFAGSTETEIRTAAKDIIKICHRHDVPVLIEDHYKLVNELKLDGVHLAHGKYLREARKAVGADKTVGVYAEASKHDGMNAAEAGADYVGFGPVNADPVLFNGTCADEALFHWWQQMIEVPVVAMGGIDANTAINTLKHADFIMPEPGLWLDNDSLEEFMQGLTSG